MSLVSPTSPAISRPHRKRKLPDEFQTSGRRGGGSAQFSTAVKSRDADEARIDDGTTYREGKKRAVKGGKPPAKEKRVKRFRPKPPANFQVVYDRAISQRFYVLSRSRSGTPECPEETVEMAGTTGNIYHVHIARVPTCTCPHSQKGNQCKHVIYVMSRVLRARFHLVYQLALLSPELREIFTDAPPIQISVDHPAAGGESKENNKRKSIEGDCPICFVPFGGPDDTVYCRAQCGQNMHKECFEMWAATKRKSARDKVTCPLCRTPWQGDDDVVKKIQNTDILGDEGYVNIADQLGISRERGSHNDPCFSFITDVPSQIPAPITVGRVVDIIMPGGRDCRPVCAASFLFQLNPR